MALLVISLIALGASALTFFSGFGLGTLLLPAFAWFMPIEAAIAATAVVHLANNLFKLGLVGKHVPAGVVLRFGVPAAVAALLGAWLLSRLSTGRALHTYVLAPGGREFEITALNLVIGGLISAFALLELSPRFERWSVPAKWMPLGGAASGFFGGLSGHQGALRSAFLIRAGLTKEQFVAAGVATAVLVDCSRLIVYGANFGAREWTIVRETVGLSAVFAGCVAALIGSVIGARLIGKMTLTGVRRIVGVALLLIGIAMAAGVV